jgi:penicillin G amidase
VKILRRSLLALLVLVVLAAGAGYLFVRSSLPQTDGTLALAGLTAPVKITRDANGVPTIVAANDHDADFALGFVHAQDRLFAMDLMRRFGAGRLSEWFGGRALSYDQTMRTLGLYRAAERQYAVLSPPVRATIDAYTAGVNAFLASRHGALPPEYYLLRIRPEVWRPADSLVWAKLMDLQLTGNYRGELLRARLLRHMKPADLDVLYPAYPKDAPLPTAATQALYRSLPLDRLWALLPPTIGLQRASNNWVLGGTRTASGKPLLANDPHLDFSTPGVWYLVRIETPGHTVAGVTAPGTPYVIIGHNNHIAWGFTTTGGDVEDLFIERPDPKDPTRYLTPGGSEPFVTRQETIRVRHTDPVTLTVRETRHGPVISDLAGTTQGEVLALQTTWLGDDDHTPEAIWAMSRARNWGEFKQALTAWTAPQQNIVYADIDGNIGFMAPSRIPIRAKGDGWLPSPGWSGAYDWTGTIPFDALPSAFNPASARVVTANNKIVGDDYPYFLTRDWETPERAERITALTDRKGPQSPETTAQIQADDVSLTARRLLPIMLAMTAKTPTNTDALDRLRAWDGRMDRDKPEPLLFTAWMLQFGRAALAARLGTDYDDYWSLRGDVIENILTQHQDWCAGENGCGGDLTKTLGWAIDGLARSYGDDMAAWRWGKAHPAVFPSQFWSQVPLLRDWLAVAIPANGGNDTVNAGAISLTDTTAPFADRHGPTLRMIVDFADPSAARFMIAPGQSGNPLSAHWRDLLRRWRDVGYLSFSADASGGVLTLTPP